MTVDLKRVILTLIIIVAYFIGTDYLSVFLDSYSPESAELSIKITSFITWIAIAFIWRLDFTKKEKEPKWESKKLYTPETVKKLVAEGIEEGLHDLDYLEKLKKNQKNYNTAIKDYAEKIVNRHSFKPRMYEIKT